MARTKISAEVAVVVLVESAQLQETDTSGAMTGRAMLCECLTAVAQQTLPPVQTLVVCDRVTPSLEELVDQTLPGSWVMAAEGDSTAAGGCGEGFVARGGCMSGRAWAGLARAVGCGTAPLVAIGEGRLRWSPHKLAAQAAAFARRGLELTGHRVETRPRRDDPTGFGIGPAEVVDDPGPERAYPPLMAALRRPAFALGTVMMRRDAWPRLTLGVGPTANPGDTFSADVWQQALVVATGQGLPHATLEAPLAEVGPDHAPALAQWPVPLPPLVANGVTHPRVVGHLGQLRGGELAGLPPGGAPRAAQAAEAVRAGLLLLYGDLDASHALSQSHEGHADFDYWHGLMHRREGDFANADYWLRRAGVHPIHEELYRQAVLLLADSPPATPRQVAGRPSPRVGRLREGLTAAGRWLPELVTATFAEAARSGCLAPDDDARLRGVQLLEIDALLRYCQGAVGR